MTKRRDIAVFLAATAAYWGSLYTYVPILSPYGEHLGGSLGMIGMIVAAYGFSQLVLRIPAGVLSDRLGKRRPFMWVGFVASIGAALGMAFADSPWQLLVFRGVSGIAATMWVTFTVLFASFFPDHQTTRSMGFLMFCSSASQLTATYGGGWLAELWGWQAPFYAAVALAIVGYGLVFMVKDRPIGSKKPLTVGALLQVGKTPQLLAVSLLGAFSQYVTFVTVYGFTPSYAAALGATKAELGVLTLISSVPAALGALLGGAWLAGRLGERRLVVGGLIIAGLATLSIPFTSSLLMLNLTQAIGGIGRGVAFPVLMAMSIQTVAPERKATAMGFFQSLYALGMTGGPAVSGLIGNFVGMTGIFYSAGAVGCIAGIVAWALFNGLLKPATNDTAPAQSA